MTDDKIATKFNFFNMNFDKVTGNSFSSNLNLTSESSDEPQPDNIVTGIYFSKN